MTTLLLGSAANPLVRGAFDIDWAFSLTLNTSGPKPHWTLQGLDDGFPAFEIYINGKPIYTRDAPPPYTLADILKLLPVVGDGLVNKSGDFP